MPLPKELKAKLRGLLKDGAELPEELDELVVFPNEGAFLEAADKKGKAKLTAAEAKASEARRAAEESATKLTDILKDIGVESPDKLEEFKTKFAQASGTMTEYDKLKGDHAKVLKDFDKLQKSHADVLQFKVNHQKRTALEPHLAKIHPDLRDDLGGAWLRDLVADDKGENFTFPGGKDIASFIDEKLKTKPSLKAPDFKGGAGTGQGADKGGAAGGGAAAGGNAGGGNSNGKSAPKTVGSAIAQALAASAAATGGGGP